MYPSSIPVADDDESSPEFFEWWWTGLVCENGRVVEGDDEGVARRFSQKSRAKRGSMPLPARRLQTRCVSMRARHARK